LIQIAPIIWVPANPFSLVQELVWDKSKLAPSQSLQDWTKLRLAWPGWNSGSWLRNWFSCLILSLPMMIWIGTEIALVFVFGRGRICGPRLQWEKIYKNRIQVEICYCSLHFLALAFQRSCLIVSWFTGILQLLRDHLARSLSWSRIPFFWSDYIRILNHAP
jgi:hypothetical protein